MAAVPLSATFILDDKYSKALMEIVKNTQKGRSSHRGNERHA